MWNRWLVLTGVVAATVISTIAALGGPRNAILNVREVFDSYPAPEIVNIGREGPYAKKFVIAVANPGLQQLLVTGYEAEPAISYASQTVSQPADGAGTIPIVATYDRPSSCNKKRIITLTRPLAIDGGRSGAIEIYPWTDPKCEFLIRVRSNRGLSATAMWSAEFIDRKKIETMGDDLPIFSDGIVN